MTMTDTPVNGDQPRRGRPPKTGPADPGAARTALDQATAARKTAERAQTKAWQNRLDAKAAYLMADRDHDRAAANLTDARAEERRAELAHRRAEDEAIG
jgi:hypothetical protein